MKPAIVLLTRCILLFSGCVAAGPVAMPTPENSSRYYSEFTGWARTNGVPYFYFAAFDEAWKVKNEGPQEAHLGIWDKEGIIKPGLGSA